MDLLTFFLWTKSIQYHFGGSLVIYDCPFVRKDEWSGWVLWKDSEALSIGDVERSAFREKGWGWNKREAKKISTEVRTLRVLSVRVVLLSQNTSDRGKQTAERETLPQTRHLGTTVGLSFSQFN